MPAKMRAMTRRLPLALLLASLAASLSCASGRRGRSASGPPLTDPYIAPVSSAVIAKARACKQVEDCGPPASDGVAWECRLGACTPTSAPPPEPAPAPPQIAAEPPLPDLDTGSGKQGRAPDRSTLPPGLFAPSPVPAPVSPGAVEPPPAAPAAPAPPPAPLPPPGSSPPPAPPASPPSTPPPAPPPPTGTAPGPT
jgi:hypothetical protein